jgi:hypothetical protein
MKLLVIPRYYLRIGSVEYVTKSVAGMLARRHSTS